MAWRKLSITCVLTGAGFRSTRSGRVLFSVTSEPSVATERPKNSLPHDWAERVTVTQTDEGARGARDSGRELAGQDVHTAHTSQISISERRLDLATLGPPEGHLEAGRRARRQLPVRAHDMIIDSTVNKRLSH